MRLNDDVNVYFPLQLIPREEQIQGLQFIKKTINSGNKFCLLNLPTGSGKSFLVNMFMNWYKNFVNPKAEFDILTNSKILQEQYIRENLFIKNFKGKSNYYCDRFSTDCEKGLEICRALKKQCNKCPYEIAKKKWIESEVGLTNFHLFNTLALYIRTTLEKRESTVLIIDECQDFESVFADYISTSTSAKSLKRYGFAAKPIEDYDEKIKKIKSIGQYVGFVEKQFIPDVEALMDYFELQILETKNSKYREECSTYLSYCLTQITKYKNLILDYKENPENWVLDITKNEKDRAYSGILLEAKPVWVSKHLMECVWNRYDHIILMSGTILDKDLFSYINGIDVKKTAYFEMDSPFHVSRRPIFYIKCGKMSYDLKEESFQNQIPFIKKILKRNENNKGIIHCGTYEFSKWLQEQLIDKRLIFHDTENREEMLEKYINSETSSVLVSPSMVTGVDLKDDLSRFQIIMKIPYPYLGSNKIKQRQKTNTHWYAWKTCVDILQMYGRSNRSEEDWSENYILDSSFSDILKYNSKNLPHWFTAAIKPLK